MIQCFSDKSERFNFSPVLQPKPKTKTSLRENLTQPNMNKSTLDMFYNMTATPQLDALWEAIQGIDKNEPLEKPVCSCCGSSDLRYQSDSYEDEDGNVTDADLTICNDCDYAE